MYYLTLFKFHYLNYSNNLLKNMLHNNADKLLKTRRTLRVLEKNKKENLKKLLKYL